MNCTKYTLLETNKWLVLLNEQGYLQSYIGMVNQSTSLCSFVKGTLVSSMHHPDLEGGIISIYDIHLEQWQIPYRGYWETSTYFRNNS